MITREASNRLSPRALAGWRRALLLLPMALGAPGCAEGAERARTVAALCGGEGEACCPEPDVPCGIQLACDASRTCRLEVLSPGANRLCQSGRDCSAGQTCCEAGNFGTCLPVLPGECPAPDLELVYDPTYVSPANEGLGFSGAFPPGLSVVRRIVDSQRNGDNIDGSLPLVAPPAAAFRSCAAEKQCVAGPGLRTLMLFSIRVYNAGDADLILGPAGAPGVQPAACDSASYSTPEASRQPVRSPPYRERYLLYQLLDEAGTPRVQSYGLAPAVTCLPAVQSTSRFSCEFLGLQQGEMEIYDKSLDCQWLDITGVPPGEYTLRATVNPGFDFGERRTDNNSVDIQVSLPTTDLLSVCPGLDNRLVWQVGAQRDCGWVSGAFETCTPGATVDLGCPGCVGDAVLRVCEGNAPCTSEQALASGDDVDSADSCPATHFTCPRSGTYTWMHGPWFGDHLDPWTCEAHVLASAVGP